MAAAVCTAHPGPAPVYIEWSDGNGEALRLRGGLDDAKPMQAESRGMLKDRVTGLTRTQMYAPRYYRRFPTAPRVTAQDAASVSVPRLHAHS